LEPGAAAILGMPKHAASVRFVEVVACREHAARMLQAAGLDDYPGYLLGSAAESIHARVT
jgi:hypothetical protein